MKNTLTFFLIIGYLTSLSAQIPKTPVELLSAFISANGNSSFDTIVDDVHPGSLDSFKKHTLRIVSAAAQNHSVASVTAAFEGLQSLDDLAQMSPKDFWVYVMGNAYSYSPITDHSKAVQIIGQVEKAPLLYLVYQVERDLKSTKQIEKLSSPKTFTFSKKGERWYYWTHQVAFVERYIHWQIKNENSQK